MSKKLEVTIPAKYPLAATLTLPDSNLEKYPAIIMVHGSGEIDRDSNAKGLPINAFKELSDLVVEQGFATLRYDKRGVGASKGDYYEAGAYDLIDDAEAAVTFAKNHPNIDSEKVILLGHSEGGIIAPIVNDRNPVSGMILLASIAEPLAKTMEWQREQMYKEIKSLKGFQGWLLRFINLEKKIKKMNDDLIRVVSETDEPVVRYKGKKINAKWNRESAEVDVSTSLKNVKCPVLAITGSKDVNVKVDDLQKIKELVQGECEIHVISDMTHMLRKTDLEFSMSKILNNTKKIIKAPVDQELKDIITNWLADWKSNEVKKAEMIIN
ncbi:alpha/beta hydrolase family protein [Cytobacillus sp. FJAT-54145]|uniref:Alpha/beta hydrolase family protein n=1 Tax=Cytobacillus spartinae TaxID=3299023 RepID=A0ABW6K7E3_9BACI